MLIADAYSIIISEIIELSFDCKSSLLLANLACSKKELRPTFVIAPAIINHFKLHNLNDKETERNSNQKLALIFLETKNVDAAHNQQSSLH